MAQLIWLASHFRYPGTPKEQLQTLEVVLQGTVNALWAQVNRVAALKAPWDPNLGVQTSTIKIRHMHFRAKTQTRMILTDYAAGWWAVIDWEPNAFLVHCAEGKPPKRIPSWQKLRTNFGLGKKVATHFEATRSPDIPGWYADLHYINLQHPMLRVLQRVIEEEARP